MPVTYQDETESATLAEHRREIAAHTDTTLRCEWCSRVLDPDGDDDCVQLECGAWHVECHNQAMDEDDLVEFLQDVARDCMERIAEYRSLHPTRAREHRAGVLLSRIERVIAAAVK